MSQEMQCRNSAELAKAAVAFHEETGRAVAGDVLAATKKHITPTTRFMISTERPPTPEKAAWLARTWAQKHLDFDESSPKYLRALVETYEALQATALPGDDGHLGDEDIIGLERRLDNLISLAWSGALRKATETLADFDWMPTKPTARKADVVRKMPLDRAMKEPLLLQEWVNELRNAYEFSSSALAKIIASQVVEDAADEALV